MVLTYLILFVCLTPFIVVLSVMGAAALGPRVTRTIIFTVFGAGCVLGYCGLAWVFIRDYRWRKSLVVTIRGDGAQICEWGREVTVLFDDVSALRLRPQGADARCVLHLRNGEQYDLPFEIASLSAVREALQATLLRQLVQRLGAELARGGSVRVREQTLCAWWDVFAGVATFFFGMLSVLSRHGRHAGELMKSGKLRIRRGWRGKGADFEVTREGLRLSGSRMPVNLLAWSDLRGLRTDEAGMVLRFQTGQVITVSLFAANGWLVAAWLDLLVPRPDP